MKRIQKAISTLQPLAEGQELPLHYQSRLRHLVRGLEILGEEVGRWQEGKAKVMVEKVKPKPQLTENQTALLLKDRSTLTPEEKAQIHEWDMEWCSKGWILIEVEGETPALREDDGQNT